jgi:hypothetical protein
MDYKNATLEEQLLAAIYNKSSLKLEMDGDKIITIYPRSVYDLDKEIVEIHGSAKISYLKGRKGRSIEKIQIENVTIWVTKNFEIIARGTSERIEEKIHINENPSSISKDDLETPPFYKGKHTL